MLGFVPQPNLPIKAFFLKGEGIILTNPISETIPAPFLVGWVERSKTQRISWVWSLKPTYESQRTRYGFDKPSFFKKPGFCN
jgi:hypothetical protein